ncbi:MAG: HD domain-containing protein [Bacteroidia bacterium]|nr:HD domain-containing protein [Bacteroidia bacterium]
MFLLFLLKITLLNSFSQTNELGIPYFINISPKEYGFENQNYSITQDNRGFIYIGNMNGVIEYDGNSWKLIKVYGNPRLDVNKKGRVFVGGYNELGYLASGRKGSLAFVSIIDKVPKQYQRFGQISNVYTQGEVVFFQTANYLFKYEKDNISLIDSSQGGLNIFKVNENIYIHNFEKGLCSYSNGKPEDLPQGDFFKKKDIDDILTYNNNLLIKIHNEKGFWIYQGYSLTPLYTPIDDFLATNIYTKGEILPDNYYVFGTRRMGLIIVDPNFRIVALLNKRDGLFDDEVADLFLDRSNHLWVALNNGISYLETPSAFTFFGINLGLKGSISALIRNNKYLYAATSQGVFYLIPGQNYSNPENFYSNRKIEQVTGINAESYRFFKIKHQLLASTSAGVYSIEGVNSRQIYRNRLETMYPSIKEDGIVYIGRPNGLSAIKYNNGAWQDMGQLKNLNKRIRTIAEGERGCLWLGTDYDGVFRVDINEGYSINAPVKEYKSKCGLPDNFLWMDVYYTGNGVVFSTFKGAFRYNYDKDIFLRDTLLGLDFSGENKWVYPIVEDNNKNLWFSSGYNDIYDKITGVAYYNGIDKKYTLYTDPFGRINDMTIEAIYPDDNGIIWFGSFDRLIRYDSKLYNLYNKDTSRFFTFIRDITVGKDSVVYGGSNLFKKDKNLARINNSSVPVFRYKYNKLHFEFSAPAFESKDRILFQNYLEGFEKNWSDWNDGNIKEYTNLPEGEYTFRVRAKNIYGKISHEAAYRFEILPPIYRKWFAYVIYIVFAFLIVFVVSSWRSYNFAKEKNKLEKIINDRTEELVKQKERSEELVANILPKETAEELISKGRADSKRYDLVTVLFADIQEFTIIAEGLNPEILIGDLDKVFFHFDSIVEKYNIEKIKTIGDAYMAAGGIPNKNRTNPIEVVLAAFEMQHHLDLLQSELHSEAKKWNIRVGVHTGSVIAGVVGSKKYSYDIWGDSVNIASRMESSGMPGKINISSKTYEHVKEFFICEPRGKLPVKYKGDIDMYFVHGIKPELSLHGEGKFPNKNFLIKLQLVRYEDMEEMVFAKLEKGLPKNLYYHNFKHTVDVTAQVEIIGRYENVSEDEMLILKTAALFHDNGFLIGYDDHELLGVKIAREILPGFKYSPEQISAICELIYSTKMPPNPRNLLEQIICDADLDYLGRHDFIPYSQNLFRELYERNKIRTMDEWNKMQIKFIEGHQYFTESARRLRDVNKNNQLEELRKMI